MKALFSPIVRGRVNALLAQAERPRWDVVFTRIAFALGVLSGLGGAAVLCVTLSGLVPGRAGVLLAGAGGVLGTACTTAAALGPRMTKAAGICRAARDGGVPFFDVLPQILSVLSDAPQIVRQAQAQAREDALKAEQERQARIERESHAAMVGETAAAVLDLLRSSSFRATDRGLVEEGVLAGPSATAPTAASQPASQAPPETDASATSQRSDTQGETDEPAN